MDLLNAFKHMKGQQVTVNGNTYTVDSKGVAKGVKPEDAAKLLQNRKAWSPAPGERAPVTIKEAPKAKQEVAPPPPVEEPAVGETEEEVAAPEEATEWPDPEESMTKDYLQSMADAYQVPYKSNTTKKELVAAIHAAMYED